MRLCNRLSKLEAAVARKNAPPWREPTGEEYRRFLAGEVVPGMPLDRGGVNDFLRRMAEVENRQASAAGEGATAEEAEPCSPPPSATTGFPDESERTSRPMGLAPNVGESRV